MVVTIRKYEKGDYTSVCKLFYNGMVENWMPAYRRTISGKVIIPNIFQLLQTLTVYMLSTSLLWFFFIEFLIQVVYMIFFFYAYWDYAWEHLNSDMRDKEMSYWTCRGVQTAGFYVATIDDVVVGTIAYIKESDKELEIFRLSTEKEHRKAGVASKLVAKIERIAAVLKCSTIKASTSSAQESALKFYSRNSWTEVSRAGIAGSFLHGIQIITLEKLVTSGL